MGIIILHETTQVETINRQTVFRGILEFFFKETKELRGRLNHIWKNGSDLEQW